MTARAQRRRSPRGSAPSDSAASPGPVPSVTVLNFVNDGTIEALGGATTLGTLDAITGTGTIQVGAGATLEIAGAVSGNTLEFTGSGAVVQIDDLASAPGGVQQQDFNAQGIGDEVRLFVAEAERRGWLEKAS